MSHALSCATPVDASPEGTELFTKAQTAYHQKNYGAALPLLMKYLKAAKPDDPRRFGVIEQVARIHLQHKRDPSEAVAFLASVKKDSKLGKENADDVEQWLATAREWQKLGGLAETDDANKLFALGEKYYRKGTSDAEAGDETGAASRYIAASYLVPFVSNFDGDPRLAKALLMLGDIRRRSWQADGYWTVDFYLKEVIRRFPKTPEARKAYKMLEEDIQIRWSGSSGDQTPEYLRGMLKKYRRLAFGSGDATTGPIKQ